MPLSPEDRDRIYEEEKARREAQDRLQHEEAIAKKEAGKKNAKRVGIGCLGLIGLLFISSLIGSVWNNLHPHIDTPEERAYKSCVSDWLDVNKVGAIAVSGSLMDRLLLAHKMCERIKPKP